MQKPKIIQRLIVTEVVIDHQKEKVSILVKNMQGQVLEMFDSLTDYSLWCENNLVTAKDFNSDEHEQENN